MRRLPPSSLTDSPKPDKPNTNPHKFWPRIKNLETYHISKNMILRDGRGKNDSNIVTTELYLFHEGKEKYR